MANQVLSTTRIVRGIARQSLRLSNERKSSGLLLAFIFLTLAYLILEREFKRLAK